MSQAKLKRARLHVGLKVFLERHGEEYHLRALGYFGSYARDEAVEGSDIDIDAEDEPSASRPVP